MIQLCFSNISFVTNETSASKKPVCKKCKSKDLSKDVAGFPLCVHCGWVDYSKDIPKAKQPKAKHLRTASVLLKYIGVGKNLLSKNKIKCACLGAKVKVPLTSFTFVEDIIMALMALMILVGV